jgi:hypothetical protein
MSTESSDRLANLLQDFDYNVESDDFILYGVDRLIEVDRASFEDEEFRRTIDEGIRNHIEEQIEIRAEIAMRLRSSLPVLDRETARIARRTIHALEDVEFPLHNVSLIVRSYTSYLFRRLEESPHESALEEEAARLIERWHNGEILREQMTTLLKAIGGPAVSPLADLLFQTGEDRMAAETAIDTLATIRRSTSARVLAHAIAEPLLDEDLELKAYAAGRALWPQQRHYMLQELSSHEHEDLPFRWFQLLVECNELNAVDLILGEVLIHGEDTTYHEDLRSLLELLRNSGDPEVEAKIVGVINAEETPAQAKQLLENFIGAFSPAPAVREDPWTRASQRAELNRKYLAAAKLYDAGRTAEALRAVDSILKADAEHPFAVGLKRLIVPA